MTIFIVLFIILSLFVATWVMAAQDMRPDRRPPEWSMGRVIQPRR